MNVNKKGNNPSSTVNKTMNEDEGQWQRSMYQYSFEYKQTMKRTMAAQFRRAVTPELTVALLLFFFLLLLHNNVNNASRGARSRWQRLVQHKFEATVLEKKTKPFFRWWPINCSPVSVASQSQTVNGLGSIILNRSPPTSNFQEKSQ